MAPFPDQVMRWARGDLADANFEQWLYRAAAAEETLGEALFLELIELDYRDWLATRAMRYRLVARICTTCFCPALLDRQLFPVYAYPAEVAIRFPVLRQRTSWLQLSRCAACGQHWYIAMDAFDDDIYLQRLYEAEARAVLDHDRWPETFDRFAHAWPAGTLPDCGPPDGFSAHHPFAPS